ncbi:MAG: 30S ribosome-binding factor RbfA [Gammaproteobacteria bacterium]|nr:30S ribosome-binding factor RbfA [Gammaproteobacteria bacterium]
MPKEFDRSRRVAEQIQRELAQLIQLQLKDPRLGMVTVSAVELSRDFSNAKVFVTVFNQTDNPQQSLQVLQHAAGFLRHALGQALRLRTLPQLHFYYDKSIARGAQLSALIHQAMASVPADPQSQDTGDHEEK